MSPQPPLDELDWIILGLLGILSAAGAAAFLLLVTGCAATPVSRSGPTITLWRVRAQQNNLGVELSRYEAGRGARVLTPSEADGYQCVSSEDLAEIMKALIGP